jgi:hypothetical protein
MRLLVTAVKELFWLSCLMWGILFMIAAATEGFPLTSIHIRDEFRQHRDKHSHHLRSGAVRNRILEHYAFRWRHLSLGERRMRPHRPAFLIS